MVQVQELFDRHDALVAADPGFEPDAYGPYSFSIFVAGALANSFPRKVSAEIAHFRANLVRTTEGAKPPEERTKMGVVLGDSAFVRSLVERFGLDWTNINGEKAHVVGGPVRNLDALIQEIGKAWRNYLPSEGAYHCEARQRDAEDLGAFLEKYRFNDPEVPILTTSAKEITTGLGLKEDMVSSMTTPVDLRKTVELWKARGFDTLVDISQGAILKSLVERIHEFRFITLDQILGAHTPNPQSI